MSTGTLGPFGYRIRLLERRGDADDVSRRRCALRRPDSVSCGLFGRPRTMSSSPSGVPVVLRLPSWSGCSAGEEPRSIHADARESGDATPTRNVSIPATACSRTRWSTRKAWSLPSIARRRAERCNTNRDQVTPSNLGFLASRSRLGAGTCVLRAAIRPVSAEETGARCHGGGAPLHASFETTTRVGTRARSKLRAARVSCLPPCPLVPALGKEGSQRRDHGHPLRDIRSLARCCHRSSDAPVGSQRVEGC